MLPIVWPCLDNTGWVPAAGSQLGAKPVWGNRRGGGWAGGSKASLG